MTKTAKIFKSGNSQALRIPKEFHFNSKEVVILRRGKEIILREKPDSLKQAFELLTSLPIDCFPQKREDAPPQDRESF